MEKLRSKIRTLEYRESDRRRDERLDMGFVRPLQLHPPQVRRILRVRCRGWGKWTVIENKKVVRSHSGPIKGRRKEEAIHEAVSVCRRILDAGGLALLVIERRDGEIERQWEYGRELLRGEINE